MDSLSAIQASLHSAIDSLEDMERLLKTGSSIHEQDVLCLKQMLQEAIKLGEPSASPRREGPIITRDENGIIVCVTWQEDDEIVEVLAESYGYPDIKDRERQALETIQNLIGAFDNPITRRKCSSEFTGEAIKQGRRYLDEHTPEEDEGALKVGQKDVW